MISLIRERCTGSPVVGTADPGHKEMSLKCDMRIHDGRRPHSDLSESGRDDYDFSG